MTDFSGAVLPSFNNEEDEEENKKVVQPSLPKIEQPSEETSTGGFNSAVLPPTNMNNVLTNIQSNNKQLEETKITADEYTDSKLPNINVVPNESTLDSMPNPNIEQDFDVVYQNEKYSDKIYLPLDPEDFEEYTMPQVINNFRAGLEAELESDPSNTHLQQLLEKETILDKRLIDKYKHSLTRAIEPERINELRSMADNMYAERQRQLSTPFIKGLAKSKGFDDPLEYLKDLASNEPEKFARVFENLGSEAFPLKTMPETPQEFFNILVVEEEKKIENQLATAQGYLNSQNPVTRKSMQVLLDSELSLGAINAITEGRSWVDPLTWLGDVSVNASRFTREWEDPNTKLVQPFVDVIREGNFNALQDAWKNGNLKDLTAAAMWTTLDVGALGEVGKLVGRGYKKAKTWMEDPSVIRDTKVATARREQLKRDEIKLKVKQNAKIKKELLKEFESKFDVKLTKVVDGELVIDRDAVKALGERKTLDLMQSETGAIINLPSDSLTAPILNAETFDSLVATLADLKEKFPKEFGKSATSIDDMLRLNIEGKIDPQDMIDILNKNGMALEEFVLATYGSVSKAGEVLGKFSHIMRRKPKGVLDDLDSRIAEKASSKIGDYYKRYFLRIENLRKGLLVAPLAVAARNQQSNFVRAPLESLNAIISNAVWRASNEGAGSALKSLNPFNERSAFKGSMDNLKLMFNDIREAKQFSEYILAESPDHARQMYNTLNEIQLGLGRGQATSITGRVSDQMLSDLEDFSAFINLPNRIQELNVRNATFFSELQRLVRNEYKIELKEALNRGMLKDLMNDASTVRPEGARSFINLMDDATRKAMRVTYSGVPENYILRKSAEFISKSPASIAIPFPKFIANGIEYFAEGTMGALSPLKRKFNATFFDRSLKGPLTARESEKIANNIIGLGIFTGLYYWQRDENRGKDYKKIGIPTTDLDADITGTYPIAQMNWIVRAAVERKNGTFDQWDAKNEWLDLFFGMEQRAGVGNIVTDEFTSLMGGVANETDEAKRDRLFGRLFGQYMTTFINPYFQVIEAERDLGFRTTDRAEAGKDFIISDNQFLNETKRSIVQRGGLDPDEEANLPKRETVTDTNEERKYIKSRILLGVSASEQNEIIDYLQEIGITDPNYTLGSRHKMYSVRNYQDERVSAYMPSFVNQAKRVGEKAELRWNKSKELQNKYTLAAYMRMYERDYMKQSVEKRREIIGEGKALVTKRLEKRTDQYIRLPKNVRRVAEAEWTRLYSKRAKDGVIDYSNPKHIEQLLSLAGVDLKPK